MADTLWQHVYRTAGPNGPSDPVNKITQGQCSQRQGGTQDCWAGIVSLPGHLGTQLTLRSWMNPNSRQEGTGTYYLKLCHCRALWCTCVLMPALWRERHKEFQPGLHCETLLKNKIKQLMVSKDVFSNPTHSPATHEHIPSHTP